MLKEQPRQATHWSVRLVAEETGISKSTVQRYLHLYGVQPHRSKPFKLSTDPFFVEKVRDIVGLYLNLPIRNWSCTWMRRARFKSLSAASRSCRLLPAGLGEVEGVDQDYYLHGTAKLFAALDVATGEVIAQCKAWHRQQEFLSFLRNID